jgi:putative hydrolase of the HAD superfamily
MITYCRHLTFNTYERGNLSLDGYLNRVVFYQNRPRSREELKALMFAQPLLYPLPKGE